VTIGIDSPPEPVFLSPDGNHRLIKIPFVGELTAGPLTKLTGEFEIELRRPFRHSLEQNLNAALGKQVFNVAKAERKPIIKPHRMGNDLSRKTMAFKVNRMGFGHAP